jgi:hypothetical protein
VFLLTTRHSLSAKFGTNFADSRGRSIGVIFLLTEGHGVCFSFYFEDLETKSHIAFKTQFGVFSEGLEAS